MSAFLANRLGQGDLTVDAWGHQKVSQNRSVLSCLFTHDIPPARMIMEENSTEVYVSSNIYSTGGAAVISADATVTTARLRSREHPRYQPNRGHLFSCSAWCPGATADGVREWGLATADNGVFFRLKADGQLYAVLRSGGSDVYESAIDTSILDSFDVTKNNFYDIQFQWRSAGNYLFFIGDAATGASRLVHKIDRINYHAATSIEDPTLPAHFLASRTTEDCELHVPCFDITSESGKTEYLNYSAAYAQNVSVGTGDIPVMCIGQPLTINGKTNTKDVAVLQTSAECDKKATFKIWATKDPTAFTGATFVERDLLGSYLLTDSPDVSTGAVRATAIDPAKAELRGILRVAAGELAQLSNPDRDRVTFYLCSGEYICVTCNATTSIATAIFELGEPS